MSVLGDTFEFEIIQIGNTVYNTDPVTGAWEVEVIESSDPGLANLGQFIAELSDLEDPVLVGEETLDVRVYFLKAVAKDMAMPMEQGTGVGDFHFDFWIGVEDNLFRQFSTEGEVKMINLPGSITIAGMMKYSDHGEPVLIDPPDIG